MATVLGSLNPPPKAQPGPEPQTAMLKWVSYPVFHSSVGFPFPWAPCTPPTLLQPLCCQREARVPLR